MVKRAEAGKKGEKSCDSELNRLPSFPISQRKLCSAFEHILKANATPNGMNKKWAFDSRFLWNVGVNGEHCKANREVLSSSDF